MPPFRRLARHQEPFTTEKEADLPRWGGVTEPMTVLTDIVLAGVAFVLGVRLAYGAAAEGAGASGMVAVGLLATAVAAVLGAAAHGFGAQIDAEARDRVWRGTLYAAGVVGAAVIASVAFFAARGSIRSAILVAAGLKLVVYVVGVARRPEFRIAATDSAGALAVLLAGVVYAYVRWRTPAMPWLVGGVLLSLVAGLVQARRLAPHRYFNHNDLFHVIQIVALYLFYRGGALLVDR